MFLFSLRILTLVQKQKKPSINRPLSYKCNKTYTAYVSGTYLFDIIARIYLLPVVPSFSCVQIFQAFSHLTHVCAPDLQASVIVITCNLQKDCLASAFPRVTLRWFNSFISLTSLCFTSDRTVLGFISFPVFFLSASSIFFAPVEDFLLCLDRDQYLPRSCLKVKRIGGCCGCSRAVPVL